MNMNRETIKETVAEYKGVLVPDRKTVLVGGALFLYFGGDRMPLCPLDGHCAYNNRNVCGVDYCLFPVGGCPHDLLQNPPGDPVLYRRALGGTIAVLVEMGRPEDEAILKKLRELFRASLVRPRDRGGG